MPVLEADAAGDDVNPKPARVDDDDEHEADGGGQEGGHSEEDDCPEGDQIFGILLSIDHLRY